MTMLLLLAISLLLLLLLLLNDGGQRVNGFLLSVHHPLFLTSSLCKPLSHVHLSNRQSGIVLPLPWPLPLSSSISVSSTRTTNLSNIVGSEEQTNRNDETKRLAKQFADDIQMLTALRPPSTDVDISAPVTFLHLQYWQDRHIHDFGRRSCGKVIHGLPIYNTPGTYYAGI
jgi:hypothetical protein